MYIHLFYIYTYIQVYTDIYLRQIFIVSPLIVTSFLNLTRRIPYTSKNQLFIVKGYVLKDYVRRHWHLKNTLRYTFLVWETWLPQETC